MIKGTIKSEAIEMRSRRYGYFPRTFVWRGHEHQVESIVRCRTDGNSAGKMQRHHFRVRCAEGEFDLYQDLQHNTWHISV